MKALYIYIVFTIINGIAFLLCGGDKWFAVKGKRRIPEKTLMSLGFLGGGLGFLCGMVLFKHKLSKKHFRVWMPLSILIYWCLFLYYQWQLQTF